MRGEEQGRREREKRRREVKGRRGEEEKVRGGAGGGIYSLISDGITDGN
jgi:hypothetical protein